MSLFDPPTFKFLTLNELDRMKDIPCMILLYCQKKHAKQERNLVCDRFVASRCRWFTSVGIDSGLWEISMDDADLRNNPDHDELWAVTESDKALTENTVEIFLDLVVDNPQEIKTAYIIGDNSESLQQLKYELLTSYKSIASLEEWTYFPQIMSDLGFEMDCNHSFDAYKVNCGLQLKKANSDREQRRNNLYVLEHADRQIVGNHLFSEWRYLTHWNMAAVNEYDIDYLHRVIDILNEKI